MVDEDLLSFCRLLFCLTYYNICLEDFQFQEVPFIYCHSHSVCTTGVIFRKWSQVPMHLRLLPTFSSDRVNITAFMMRSIWTWVLCMVIYIYIYLQFSTCWQPVLQTQLIKDAFHLPLYHLASLLKNRYK